MTERWKGPEWWARLEMDWRWYERQGDVGRLRKVPPPPSLSSFNPAVATARSWNALVCLAVFTPEDMIVLEPMRVLREPGAGRLTLRELAQMRRRIVDVAPPRRFVPPLLAAMDTIARVSAMDPDRHREAMGLLLKHAAILRDAVATLIGMADGNVGTAQAVSLGAKLRDVADA